MAAPDSERLLAIIEAQNEVISSGLELGAVRHLVVLRARSLTGADAAVVELVDGEEMVFDAVAGTAEAHAGLCVRRDSSLSGMCVTLDQVLRCDDTATDARVHRGICAKVGAGSMVCAPLRRDDAVAGALTVYSAAPHAFTAEDESTLELLGGLVAARLRHASRFEEEEAESDRRDPLTGLANLRAYDERLVLEAERARRYEHPLALVLLNLDDFKTLNAELGHGIGDEVLVQVAAVLSGSRFADAAFRIDGDEFAVLLPETDIVGAETVAERLAAQVSASALGGGRVTASWGAASGDGDPVLLHKRANMALVTAKFGNGRRFAAGSDPTPESDPS
jgi:diguanylate cyclase (GGDEF)-like protein